MDSTPEKSRTHYASASSTTSSKPQTSGADGATPPNYFQLRTKSRIPSSHRVQGSPLPRKFETTVVSNSINLLNRPKHRLPVRRLRDSQLVQNRLLPHSQPSIRQHRDDLREYLHIAVIRQPQLDLRILLLRPHVQLDNRPHQITRERRRQPPRIGIHNVPPHPFMHLRRRARASRPRHLGSQCLPEHCLTHLRI